MTHNRDNAFGISSMYACPSFLWNVILFWKPCILAHWSNIAIAIDHYISTMQSFQSVGM